MLSSFQAMLFLESPRQGYAVRTDGGIVAQRRPPIPIDSRKPESPGARGYNMYIYIYIYIKTYIYIYIYIYINSTVNIQSIFSKYTVSIQ